MTAPAASSSAGEGIVARAAARGPGPRFGPESAPESAPDPAVAASAGGDGASSSHVPSAAQQSCRGVSDNGPAGYGISTVEPIVRRASRSRCACATS